jgi:hypothetical protein
MKQFLIALAFIGCIFTANSAGKQTGSRTPERSHERRLL